ncbi:MAG: hypothetical protein HY722_17170, partial [Planctomycetes bacterium]|nr:hypothetical protein [Planctomycetota bacterium]
STLYAGTFAGTYESGLFKTTDGGASWSAANTGLTSTIVRALAIDPSAPSTLYAGTVGGVFKTTDGGAGWSAANAGLTSAFVRALVIDPSAPSTVYAGTEYGGVYKTR